VGYGAAYQALEAWLSRTRDGSTDRAR